MNMCKFFEIFINIHKDIYLSNNVLSIETIFLMPEIALDTFLWVEAKLSISLITKAR